MDINVTFETLFSKLMLFADFAKDCCETLSDDVEAALPAISPLRERVLNKHRARHFLHFLRMKWSTPEDPIKFEHLVACMLVEHWIEEVKLRRIVVGVRNGREVRLPTPHNILNHESLWDKTAKGKFANTPEMMDKLIELRVKCRFLIADIVDRNDVDLLRDGTLQDPIQEGGWRFQKLREIALAHIDLAELRKNSKLKPRGILNNSNGSLRMSWYAHLLRNTYEAGRISPVVLLSQANDTVATANDPTSHCLG